MTKEEIKQKFEDTAILIINRIQGLLDNKNLGHLEIVHKIQSDIEYHLASVALEAQKELDTILEEFYNPY